MAVAATASVGGRALSLLSSQAVGPYELVQGMPGGLRDDGTFVAKVVFNWTYASPTYMYDTVENGVLGSLAENRDTLTTLRTFYRHPEDHLERHVLENMERYYVTVRVRSICAPHHIITQARYCLNLTSSFDFITTTRLPMRC